MSHSSCDDGCHELLIPLDWLTLMFWMVMGSIVAALGGLGLYVYFLRKGQFEDDEAVKYQIFREDNPDN